MISFRDTCSPWSPKCLDTANQIAQRHAENGWYDMVEVRGGASSAIVST